MAPPKHWVHPNKGKGLANRICNKCHGRKAPYSKFCRKCTVWIPVNKGKGLATWVCSKCNGKKAPYAKLCIKCNNTKFQKGVVPKHAKPELYVCPKCGGKKSGGSKTCYSCYKKREVSQETRIKMSKAQKGRQKTPAECMKISLSKRGEKSHFWNGGITKANELLRRGIVYKNWRKSVFERDGYTCQECGQRGGELNADHIKPFAFFPELRYELSNGRTLCKPCHMKTPTFAKRTYAKD